MFCAQNIFEMSSFYRRTFKYFPLIDDFLKAYSIGNSPMVFSLQNILRVLKFRTTSEKPCLYRRIAFIHFTIYQKVFCIQTISKRLKNVLPAIGECLLPTENLCIENLNSRSSEELFRTFCLQKAFQNLLIQFRRSRKERIYKNKEFRRFLYRSSLSQIYIRFINIFFLYLSLERVLKAFPLQL